MNLKCQNKVPNKDKRKHSVSHIKRIINHRQVKVHSSRIICTYNRNPEKALMRFAVHFTRQEAISINLLTICRPLRENGTLFHDFILRIND